MSGFRKEPSTGCARRKDARNDGTEYAPSQMALSVHDCSLSENKEYRPLRHDCLGGKKSKKLIRGLRAMNGWPREVTRAQHPQTPVDICLADSGQIAARNWFLRGYRAENGGRSSDHGSFSAGKFFSGLAPRTTLVPSVRGLQRTSRNESAQTFEQISPNSIEWRVRKHEILGRLECYQH